MCAVSFVARPGELGCVVSARCGDRQKCRIAVLIVFVLLAWLATNLPETEAFHPGVSSGEVEVEGILGVADESPLTVCLREHQLLLGTL